MIVVLQYSCDPTVPELKFLPICEGIQFAVVRIQQERWSQVSFPRGEDYLLLNYCQDGRCEAHLADNQNICLSTGDLCLSVSTQVKEPFTFPTGSYSGLELSLNLKYLQEERIRLLDTPLDILSEIMDRYDLYDQTFVANASTQIHRLTAQIYSSALCDDMLFLKLDILRLLITLASRDKLSRNRVRTAYPKSRAKIAKEIEKTVCEDLSRHISLSELAEQFHINEGSLKNIFRSVYGQSYSDYLRTLRIRSAMKELSSSDRNISDIAVSVGYENPSKFSSAFKRVNGITPQEYRLLHKEKG